MSTPIPFPGNAGNVLPDGPVAGSRKRKQAFSLKDPDNTELARLATQAAKKKAKLSKINSSEKATTNQKLGTSNRQPSVEEVEDVDNNRHRVFSRNPKNIIESDDDDEAEVTEATKKKANLFKPNTLSQKKKTNHKTIPKLNIIESDDNTGSKEEDDEEAGNFPTTSEGADEDEDDDDEVVVVEKPAESAEAELSK
jgi:hypothetical protein